MSSMVEPNPLSSNQAPSQAAWDAMSCEERARVVATLSSSFEEHEASPPEGDAHFQAKLGVYDALGGHFKRLRRSVYVGSELAVYYPGAPRFAPDILIAFEVEPHPREKWVVSAEGKGLDFVLEVHYGGDRSKDAVRNVTLYASLGIPEYFIYDRRAFRLYGYRLPTPEARKYEPIIPQAGQYHSQMLGLALMLEEDRLRFFTTNAPILESHEWTERLEHALNRLERRVDAEVELRRAAEARAEREAARAEQETARAEQETARAEQEAARAEQEAARAEQEAARAKKEAARAERAEQALDAARMEIERLGRK